MKSTSAVGIAVLGVVFGGCATIIGGSSQRLSVNANVDNAEVFLNDKPLGRTPLVVEIKRGKTGRISVRKPGYTPYEIAINKEITGVFWLNIFIGGTTGSTTDYTTGAMYKYEPDTYFASLQPIGQSANELDTWRRRETLRAFVLLNSEALVSDLAAGEGEYVDVLVRLLAVQPERREGSIERWRRSYAAADTATGFAATLVAEVHPQR